MIGEPLPIGFPKFWEKISRLKEWYVYEQTVYEAHLEILHAPPYIFSTYQEIDYPIPTHPRKIK